MWAAGAPVYTAEGPAECIEAAAAVYTVEAERTAEEAWQLLSSVLCAEAEPGAVPVREAY